MSEDLFQVRFDKRKKLQELGVEPYGRKYETALKVSDLHNDFEEKKEVSIAGRIISMRKHGKTVFCDLKDETGKIQLYVKKSELVEEQGEVFGLLDIGDIVGVSGLLFKTHMGETTVYVKDITILSKSLRPLPEKWHGLKDIEKRYRQRYVDLIVNEDAREVLKTRSKIIAGIRNFLDSKGFLEVETPMMQSIPGGATARPFVTHHNALDLELYLRIAPELYLKRLLVGGLEKVYEINRNFRNEGISYKHNPEFTMMEVYASFCDYEDMMNLTEEVVTHVMQETIGSLKSVQDEQEIDFARPWKRMDLLEELKTITGVDFLEVEDSIAVGEKLGIEKEQCKTKGDLFNNAFEKYIESKIINPTFVVGYPAYMCPLAKTKKDDPRITERFELIVNGQELANAYSELNDPVEQRERLIEQGKYQKSEEHQWTMDEDFVRALEYGMPPAGGLGIGIDRLVMVLTGQHSIRDVIFFPQMKPEVGIAVDEEEEEETKEEK